MKLHSKALLLSLSLILTSLSGVVTASANDEISYKQSNSTSQNGTSFVDLDDTKPIFDPNFKEKAIKQGLDPDTIIAGYYVPFPSANQDPNPNEMRPYEFGGNEIFFRNIDMVQITGNIIDRLSARGPGPLAMQYIGSVSTTFSAELSSEFGLDGSKIAAKIGTSFQSSVQFTKSFGPIDVPAGKTYTIYCCPTYNYYSFDVWEDDPIYDDYLGTYSYQEPTGIYFYWQDMTGI